MAVLQVLAEMIRPVKFLGAVALSKLVVILQVPDALVPVLVRRKAPVPGADS